jgi:cytochrome c
VANGCVGCHTLAGVSAGRIGPDLTDLAARAGSRVPGLTATDYVRQSLGDPQAFIVEGFGDQMPDLGLTDQEIAVLTDYLLSG